MTPFSDLAERLEKAAMWSSVSFGDDLRQAAQALRGMGEALKPFSDAYGDGCGWPKDHQSVFQVAGNPSIRSWHFKAARSALNSSTGAEE